MNYVWNDGSAPLIVRLENGMRRSLRPAEILDLAELDDERTEVIYRSGVRVTVHVPFDTLYAAWVDRMNEVDWAPR